MLGVNFKTFYQQALLSEGGNIFSSRRINKNEIIPTIKSLEKLTGLPLETNVLGSTGKKESSGDIDLVVDSNRVNKDEFIKALVSKGVDPSSLKKTGIEVAYKAPIIDSNGNKTEDFVQVDFMFSEVPDFLKFYYSNNEDIHKGSVRNILLAAIAKTKGLTLSMKGLSDRETKQLISTDPEIVTKKVLGKDATLQDIHNVVSVIKYLKKHYSDEEIKTIVEPAEETTGVKFL
jgi:hypothetical protein